MMSDEQAAVTKPTNNLGLAGFIVSLIGLCGTGGLLSPIGLIISLVALKHEPKGFAIAGIVIGALGSCGILITLIFLPLMLLGFLIAIGATGAAVTVAAIVATIGGPTIGAALEMTILSAMIEKQQADNGSLPLTFADATSSLDADSGLRTDHWDNEYIYELTDEGQSFTLTSMGEDGILGTDDDIEFGSDFSFNFDNSALPTTPSQPAVPDEDAAPEAPSGEGEPQ